MQSKVKEMEAEAPESTNIVEYRDQCLEKILGGSKSGPVRTYGLGPTRTDIYGLPYIESEAQKEAIENEVNVRVQSVVENLESKLRQEMGEKIREEIEGSIREEMNDKFGDLQNQLKVMADMWRKHMEICPTNLDSRVLDGAFSNRQVIHVNIFNCYLFLC